MRVRTATSLRARLREGTAELHRAVEARLALGERDLTLDRYRDVLAALHGFYEPLEQRLAAVAAARPLGLMLRRRAPLLADDLAWLGLSHDAIARLPRCTQLPCVDDAGDAAGCLYVVEGAALGGRVVTRALQARLGTTAERGGRFFADGGGDVPRRWATVVAWLDALGCDAHQAALAAARATFRTLDDWLRERDGAP